MMNLRSSHTCFLLALLPLILGGCVSREMVINSEPQGATVYVNEAAVGKTPLQMPFKHYGTFRVRLEKPGYYPLDVNEPVAVSYTHLTLPTNREV